MFSKQKSTVLPGYSGACAAQKTGIFEGMGAKHLALLTTCQIRPEAWLSPTVGSDTLSL